MRVFQDTTAKQEKKKRKRAPKKGRGIDFSSREARKLVADVLRLEKTINTIHNQINTLSKNLSQFESEYKQRLNEMLMSNQFYVSLNDLLAILGEEEFNKYLTSFLEFAEHVSTLRKDASMTEAYTYIRDDGSVVIYFDKYSIPEELKEAVVKKKVVIW